MDHNLPVSPWPEWTITEKTGEGSFGCVYKAVRTEQGHTFYSAIKVISIPATREELNAVLAETKTADSARDYFAGVMEDCISEISTMDAFRGNSYVVSVEDFMVREYLDEIGWDIFLRMEYLTSFPKYCLTHTMTEEDVCRLGADLCRALLCLWKMDIVHRDIKPENIFVSRFGNYKLGDFGIARKLEKDVSGLSKKGTYSYMAPEVYHGEAYDGRADIYSLGLVLYRLLNQNRLPFISLEKQLITHRDKEDALNRRMSGEELPAASAAGREMDRIIRRACAFDPEKRYQAPEEMLRDLEAWLSGSRTRENSREEDRAPAPEKAEKPKKTKKTKAAKKKPPKPVRKSLLRRVLPWAAAAVALLTVLVIFTVYIKNMLENTVREQTTHMLETLQTGREVSEEDTGEDFASSIDLVSRRAEEIVQKLPSCREEGTEGDVLRYYDDDGKLLKALVYPSSSAEGLYEEYYYWNGELFFAYIWENDQADIYYYRDGILIRWIDREGTVHDNEQDSEEYVDRGDRYWYNSILQRR